MTGFADVSSAFVQAWVNGGLGYPTAYEAVDFTPPTDAPWCELKILPVNAQAVALGDTAPIEHVVLGQIDINYPAGQGAGPLLADAAKVAILFQPGATFTYNGMRLVSSYCQRSQIMRVDAFNVVSLTTKLRGWQHRA